MREAGARPMRGVAEPPGRAPNPALYEVKRET